MNGAPDRLICSPQERQGARLIIQTTNGKDILVDEEDYPNLSRHSWYELSGYAVRNVAGVMLSMHRQLMIPAPGLVVDHINGDRLDNRKSNLRTVTQAENCRNRVPSNRNRSGHLGVNFDRRFELFAAHINGECLGHFATLEEAIKARLTEELARWGIQPRRRAAFEAAGLA